MKSFCNLVGKEEKKSIIHMENQFVFEIHQKGVYLKIQR